VRYVRAFALFWWNFVVGDDWRAALGLAVALGATYALAHEGVNAWWLLPIGVVVVLVASVWWEAAASDD
jgi:hypothetical protein